MGRGGGACSRNFTVFDLLPEEMTWTLFFVYSAIAELMSRALH